MVVGLQVGGLVLGLVSWCLQSSCTSSHMWRVKSQAETVTSSSWQFEGLWMSCAATSMGSVQCSRFKTVLGLPAHLQICRGLMIVSLLLGLASIMVSVLGLKCTKIGGASEQVKGQMVLSGGIMFILSGVFTLSAVSWFAARVIQDFYDPLYAGVRFELGSGLYLGWASSCLALLGGSLLCCSYRRTPSTPLLGKITVWSTGVLGVSELVLVILKQQNFRTGVYPFRFRVFYTTWGISLARLVLFQSYKRKHNFRSK